VTNTIGGTRRKSRLGVGALIAALGCLAAVAAFPACAAASTVTLQGQDGKDQDP
jgi:hypothetical protein